MAVKERTLTQEIAWRLADVYAAQTHGNYDEETLFDRGGDWAADEVGKVLSERLGVPTEALEAGVVWEMVEALERCKEIIDDLECECDSYHGFECSIHKARELVRGVLAKVRGGGAS